MATSIPNCDECGGEGVRRVAYVDRTSSKDPAQAPRTTLRQFAVCAARPEEWQVPLDAEELSDDEAQLLEVIRSLGNRVTVEAIAERTGRDADEVEVDVNRLVADGWVEEEEIAAVDGDPNRPEAERFRSVRLFTATPMVDG